MQKQTLREQARLRARQTRAKVREEQAEKERRLARWGEAVVLALAERDAVVAECEQRAGPALRSLITEGGLSLDPPNLLVIWPGRNIRVPL